MDKDKVNERVWFRERAQLLDNEPFDTQIYLHVINKPGIGVKSPLDGYDLSGVRP